MSTENKVSVPIQSTFDPSGTEAAASGFARAKAQAHELGSEFKELGYNAEKIGGKLKGMVLELVAFSEVISQFKEGYAELKTINAAWARLTMDTARTGEDFAKVKGEINDFAEELKKVKGVADEESIPALGRLYRSYGNLEQAINAGRLALAVSAYTGKGYAESVEVVHMAAVGNIRALKDMGIVIEGATGASMRGEEALKKLAAMTRTATVNQGSLGVQTAKLKAEWDDFRGEVVGPFTVAMLTGVKWIHAFFEMLGNGAARLATHFIYVKEEVGVLYDKVMGFITRDEKRRADADARGIAARKIYDETLYELDSAYEKKVEKILDTKAEKTKVGFKGELKGLADSLAEKEKATAREMTAEEAAQTAMSQHMFKQWEVQQKKYEEHLKHMTKLGFDYLKAYQKEHERAIEAQTEVVSQNLLRQARLEQAKNEWSANALNSSINTLGEAFGFGKELAIAQATINTYEGATKALSQGGIYGIALAAVVVAAGLAQIAQISSQDAPSANFSAFKGNAGGVGFDDPNNDQAARLGGRKWAADMIGEWTQGVSAGWKDGMGGGSSSVTNDNRRTFNVHLHGTGLLDPTNVQQLKTLQRNLDMVGAQIDNQRTIARSKA